MVTSRGETKDVPFDAHYPLDVQTGTLWLTFTWSWLELSLGSNRKLRSNF